MPFWKRKQPPIEMFHFTRSELELLLGEVKKEVVNAMVDSEVLTIREGMLWDASRTVTIRKDDEISYWNKLVFNEDPGKLKVYVAELENLNLSEEGRAVIEHIQRLEEAGKPQERIKEMLPDIVNLAMKNARAKVLTPAPERVPVQETPAAGPPEGQAGKWPAHLRPVGHAEIDDPEE